ncbi:MAG TPA: hypothetical protein VM715_01115 [Candidatus Acidoferrum sp.]|nr:hypothetical protein [Candidatus Acidoferrum sp.]
MSTKVGKDQAAARGELLQDRRPEIVVYGERVQQDDAGATANNVIENVRV